MEKNTKLGSYYIKDVIEDTEKYKILHKLTL